MLRRLSRIDPKNLYYNILSGGAARVKCCRLLQGAAACDIIVT